MLSENRQSERVLAEFVSGNYFRMLDVRLAAGRLIDEDDDRTEGAAAVAVISYRLWQERFGGPPDAVGRRVLINDQPFQIVGVASRDSPASRCIRRTIFKSRPLWRARLPSSRGIEARRLSSGA